ncbi:MAG: exonuclease SbcCD subunit D [Eggerthellaceae bacterium]|nr:exonuclease SbcCD subunit D [Eggerthellaceae bacterium]
MRFLHISDLHIGKRVNGISLVEDQEYILAQIVEIACERDVDALVIAGDIYDKASPSAEAVTVFDGFLTKLASMGVCVLAIPGNHDSAERIAYAQGLLSAQGICFPPVFAGEVSCVRVADDHGDVCFWLLPFLRPGDVRRFFPDAEIGDNYAAALRAVLEACSIDRSQRNVIVMHQLVTAGGVAPERADDEIKLGGIDAVDVSVYDDFDYVALGHVHRPQRVGRDTVRYSGSVLKYSFSEARYPKSAVLVELGPKQASDDVGACVSFELVPLVPLHDMREVCMTLTELLALGQDDAAGAAMADTAVTTDAARYDYLHITLTDEHPQLDAMARIREVFPNAMALDYENVAILAARAHVCAAVDPDELDTVQLFGQFFEEQVGKPLDEVQHGIVTQAVAAVERAYAGNSARGEEEAR